MTKKIHKRSLKDRLFFYTVVKANLRKSYLKIHPGPDSDAKAFFGSLFQTFQDLDDPHNDDPFEILRQLFLPSDSNEIDLLVHSKIGPILISAIYVYRFETKNEDEHVEEAWSYIADALYWCGYATSGRTIAQFSGIGGDDLTLNELSTLQEQAVRKSISDINKEKRANQYKTHWGLIKEYALTQARTMKPDGGWIDTSKAVRKIKKSVFAYALNEHSIEMGDADGRGRTIESWLNDMPDADQIFRKKNSKQ